MLVELPGIEPAALPGLLPSELPVRYVSFRFNTARYLRIPIRVLTASKADRLRRCRQLDTDAACTPADLESRGNWLVSLRGS